ncbi:hypothetical protein EC919_11475 [Pseudomonas graminis]|uniref:hypothetical protein n=1 Tax=Pseudomonas graminis TaxID=158627 RepID=UPI00105E5653|nr:hypothetical protein [Pseudomonas graminis]TDV44403.1 hypothetical protein EC919_11475 [Pseudomonas graminis]
MPDITVTAIKGFNTDGLNTEEKYARRGSKITVDEIVARDLLLSGLIEDYDVKNSPDPQNKQGPKPENKSGGKPKPDPNKKAD